METKKLNKLTLIPFLSIGILFLSLYGFQKQEKLFPPEKHEVIIQLVLVDVIATDKDGNAVRDLTIDDFEIYEDGKKVSINSLDFFNFQMIIEKFPEEKKTEKMSLPSVEKFRKRLFFVIFDSINTIKRVLDQSKPKIIEKLISLVKLGGEIMVIELREKGDVQLLQSITSDEDLIAQAIDKASGSIWVEKSADTLSIPNIIRIEEIEAGGQPHPMRQSAREIYQLETRNRFEKSLSSLLSVINMIKNYPGRKPVLLISGGFPSISFEQVYDGIGYDGKSSEINIVQSEVAAAKIKDPFKVLQKKKRRHGSEIFRDLVNYANSHNITFYTLDPDNYLRFVLHDMAYDNFPRQLLNPKDPRIVNDDIAEIKKIELSNLNYLSENTGGVSLQGAKKFDNFQKYVNQDLTSYYELNYYPKRKKADGKYHKIKVKVKRPGVRIRFRKGYYDYNLEQKESLLFASSSANPGLFKQISFKARTVPFILKKDKYILWINMALPVQGLILGEDPSIDFKILKANFCVDDEKDNHAMMAQLNIPIMLTQSFRQKLKNARYLGYNTCSQELKLKHNKYHIIFSLYDEESSRVGTVEQLLEVPSLKGKSKAEIVNAIFGRMVESNISSRPFTISQEDGTLLVGKHKFYPMGSNQFSREENISLFIQVFTSQKEVEFTPQFPLFQNDIEVGIVPVEVVKKSRNKKANILNVIFNLDFRNFTKGDYALKISLTDSMNKQRIEKRLLVKII